MTVIDQGDGAQPAAHGAGDVRTVSGQVSEEGRALPPFVGQRVCLLVHCGDTRHGGPHDNGGWGDDGEFHLDTVAEMVAMMTEHGWTPTTDRTTATSQPALTIPGTLVTRDFSDVRMGRPADQLPTGRVNLVWLHPDGSKWRHLNAPLG